MLIKEINASSCMNKSKITDYVINPYTGCQHGCRYCYAVFIKKFQNINEPWGDFVYVKINCPELLKKELENNKPGHIWLSSVCDCYQPLEKKYKLTRKILKTINKFPNKNKFTIEILTKSSLVERDFDLLKQLNVELGCSISNLDEKTAKIIEPFTSSPKKRIQVLKKAKQQGIKTYGFISPVLPGITNLEELFEKLSFCDYVWVELLNTKKSVLNRLMPIIKKGFPEKIKDFEFAINNPEEHHKNIKKQVEELKTKYKLRVKGVIKH